MTRTRMGSAYSRSRENEEREQLDQATCVVQADEGRGQDAGDDHARRRRFARRRARNPRKQTIARNSKRG